MSEQLSAEESLIQRAEDACRPCGPCDSSPLSPERGGGMSEHTDENGAPEDDGLPCLATGETDVDGAVLPVACDLWLGHDRSHYDQTMIVFWGREHGGREYAIPPGSPAPSPTQGAGAEEAEGRG